MKKNLTILKKKWFWASLIGFLLVLTITIIPRVRAATQSPEEKYETVKVVKNDIFASVSASGKVRAEEEALLKFQTSGLLTWVGVKEGDRVKKWQAIASLDVRELEKDTRQKMLAYLEERWDFEQSQDDYEVGGRTLEKTPLSDEEKRILEKAQFDLDDTVLDLEIADLSQRLATLTSPIDGILTQIEAPLAGVNVTPATAEFTIINPAGMKFVANIDEIDVGQVRLGQKAIITLDAYPDETFTGEVGKIAFAAVATSGGGTAFPIDIHLPENLEEKFKWGMNGDVEVVTAEESGVLTVPLEALIEKDDKQYLQIIEGGKLQEVQIKTGLESEIEIQVLNGLDENGLVVIDEKEKKSGLFQR